MIIRLHEGKEINNKVHKYINSRSGWQKKHTQERFTFILLMGMRSQIKWMVEKWTFDNNKTKKKNIINTDNYTLNMNYINIKLCTVMFNIKWIYKVTNNEEKQKTK